jgi:hypothetical integral membrane protein (TIGR02206 family)
LFRYITPDYTGAPFALFGTAHIVTSLVLLGAGAYAIRAARRGSMVRKHSLRRLLAYILAVNELSWHAWNLVFGLWDIQHMLPLHLCSVMIWVTIYVFLTEKTGLYPVVYFLGVAGAVQAIITPDAGPFGFPHFRFFQTMIAHTGLVVAGLWVVMAEDCRPDFRSFVRVLVGLNVYAAVVWIVNLFVGSNYLYMGGKPATTSVLDFFPEWPWYVVILEVVAFAVLGLLYLPFRKEPATAAA